MKIRLIITGIIIIFLLAGCAGKDIEENDNKVIELTEQAFLLNESNHVFIDELSKSKAEELVFEMKENNCKLVGVNEEYGKVTEGLTDAGNGKKVSCYKLPVTFSFSGDEQDIVDFINSLKNSSAKIVMNRFELEEENEKYSLDCVVSFIGSSSKIGVAGKSGSLSMVKNEKEVVNDDEIKLRDFDVNMTIRPSNSDAAAVTVSNDSGNALYSDENAEIDVKTIFYKDGNSYFCEYSVGSQTQKDKISVGNEVKFDILSCEKVLNIDAICVNLLVENKDSKKVSVVVYNDPDERVKITKSGNVEVSKK